MEAATRFIISDLSIVHLSRTRDDMSARLWPAKQSILPVIPTTPLTVRLNLNCHKLNHPTRLHLFLDDDKSTEKLVQEQVLSRRKDHTIPTRWSLYRPLIRNAQQVDLILANRANTQQQPDVPATHPLTLPQKPARVLTQHIRRQWRKKQTLQGYKQVREWLSVEYEASRCVRIGSKNR